MGSEVLIDNFLSDFDSFRAHCDGVDYAGETSPVDGVFYPGVSEDIPESIKSEILSQLSIGMDKEVVCNFMFLRLSVDGVHVPHEAHTDNSMGQYSLMLYLNNLEGCIGGTSFVIHKETGLFQAPINDAQIDVWKADTNNTEAWSILSMCDMQPNRALVFEADKMHRALPVGGFGKGAEDGRLVLTMFFDVK